MSAMIGAAVRFLQKPNGVSRDSCNDVDVLLLSRVGSCSLAMHAAVSVIYRIRYALNTQSNLTRGSVLLQNGIILTTLLPLKRG